LGVRSFRLGAEGEAGVSEVLRFLKEEIDTTLAVLRSTACRDVRVAVIEYGYDPGNGHYLSEAE
jgi:isopentenyl diphosphate isomerase/L-lactate dehydrogenase-like FMN-dependent dehydrogenase